MPPGVTPVIHVKLHSLLSHCSCLSMVCIAVKLSASQLDIAASYSMPVCFCRLSMHLARWHLVESF